MANQAFRDELASQAKEGEANIARTKVEDRRALLARGIIGQMRDDAKKQAHEGSFAIQNETRLIQGCGFIRVQDRNVMPVLNVGNVRLTLSGNHKKYKAEWHFAINTGAAKELTSLLHELAAEDGFQLSEPGIALHKAYGSISSLIPGWGYYQTRGHRDIRSISKDEFWLHRLSFEKLVESNDFRFSDKARMAFMGGGYDGIVVYYATIGWRYQIKF